VLISSALFPEAPTEYVSLFLISVAGAIVVVLAGDLVILFVAWELMSFPTYVLAALGRKKEAVEGATKYLILGLLSSMLMVFAIALFYGVSGTTSLSGFAMIIEGGIAPDMQPVALLAALLFIVAFGFKIGVVPFHMWVPDCYQGSEGVIAAYLAGGTKKAGVSALLRILLVSFIFLKLDWTWMVIVLAVITMFVGNFMALTQRNLARLLAYSSIAMMGYLLVGVAAANELGATGAIFHALIHAIMKTAAFIAITMIAFSLGKTNVEYDDIAGLWKRAPLTSVAFTVAIISLAGIPPTAGFFSKFTLFLAAVDADLVWLAMVAILNSVLSLGYYLNILKHVYLVDPNEDTKLVEPKAPLFIIVVSAIMLVAMGIFTGPILDFMSSAASSFNL
jgi:NADH-quinone oxidoreductase subunit N